MLSCAQPIAQSSNDKKNTENSSKKQVKNEQKNHVPVDIARAQSTNAV